MTTIGEKQADVATLIDDIANTATGLSAWSDADIDVTNSGSDASWQNNGRVLHHSPSDTYLLFYIPAGGSSGSFRPALRDSEYDIYTAQGVRIVLSADWDIANTRPAGKTTIVGRDSMSVSGSVPGSSDRPGSFESVRSQPDESGLDGAGVWVIEGGQNSAPNRSTTRSTPVTYSASGRSDGLTVAAWNTTDGASGLACAYCFEYTNGKFWSDGNLPVAQLTHGVGSRRDGEIYRRFGVANYGFSSYYSDENSDVGQAGNDGGTISDSAFGSINPNADDQSFFFRKPVIFTSNTTDTPVANFESVLPNNLNDGAAHGDIITHDSTTYRIMKQSGASDQLTMSLGLQFE